MTHAVRVTMPTTTQIRDTDALALRGIRLFNSEDHPHAPAGSPKGGQFSVKSSTGTGDAKAKPAKRPPAKAAHKPVAHHKAPAKKATPKKAATPAPAAPATHPMLAAGRNNDPTRVKELQHLLTVLKLGNVAADGRYGTATEDAVKAAQVKLGMSPTGHASASFFRKLQAAQALSPCLGKG